MNPISLENIPVFIKFYLSELLDKKQEEWGNIIDIKDIKGSSLSIHFNNKTLCLYFTLVDHLKVSTDNLKFNGPAIGIVFDTFNERCRINYYINYFSIKESENFFKYTRDKRKQVLLNLKHSILSSLREKYKVFNGFKPSPCEEENNEKGTKIF